MVRVRYPDATVHVWPIDVSIPSIPTDGLWDFAGDGCYARIWADGTTTSEQIQDIRTDHDAETVALADGTPAELWRGVVYMDPDLIGMVKWGWGHDPSIDIQPAPVACASTDSTPASQGG